MVSLVADMKWSGYKRVQDIQQQKKEYADLCTDLSTFFFKQRKLPKHSLLISSLSFSLSPSFSHSLSPSFALSNNIFLILRNCFVSWRKRIAPLSFSNVCSERDRHEALLCFIALKFSTNTRIFIIIRTCAVLFVTSRLFFLQSYPLTKDYEHIKIS